jgi:DNA helicase II / ATP-dependent DNA helicase PcrA
MTRSSVLIVAYLALGQRAFHPKFGYGRISAVEGNKLTVEFEKAGQKRVAANFVEAV